MPHIISNSDSCDTAEGFVISSSDNYITAQCTILPLLAVHCSGDNYNRTRGLMFPLSEGCQLAGRCVCLHYNETSPLIDNECGQFLFSDNIDASDVVRPWHKCVKLLIAFFRQQITDGPKYFLNCISLSRHKVCDLEIGASVYE